MLENLMARMQEGPGAGVPARPIEEPVCPKPPESEPWTLDEYLKDEKAVSESEVEAATAKWDVMEKNSAGDPTKWQRDLLGPNASLRLWLPTKKIPAAVAPAAAVAVAAPPETVAALAAPVATKTGLARVLAPCRNYSDLRTIKDLLDMSGEYENKEFELLAGNVSHRTPLKSGRPFLFCLRPDRGPKPIRAIEKLFQSAVCFVPSMLVFFASVSSCKVRAVPSKATQSGVHVRVERSHRSAHGFQNRVEGFVRKLEDQCYGVGQGSEGVQRG
jgi:hypothetical protein